MKMMAGTDFTSVSKTRYYQEDLYKLEFIALDSQSTIRKVIDAVLSRCEIDTHRLKVEMELNSIEAIKNAVNREVGRCFVSLSAIPKSYK